jgi:hypothetical protein
VIEITRLFAQPAFSIIHSSRVMTGRFKVLARRTSQTSLACSCVSYRTLGGSALRHALSLLATVVAALGLLGWRRKRKSVAASINV